ncbi:hypothetical protein GCM10010193_68200 [Kitasatospora atroaurantiaca]|uniref:hypothetical protein n=1 Tax=Kitasatospora atroaurantiaca TaxID=285545 RepID=UPI003383E301
MSTATATSPASGVPSTEESRRLPSTPLPDHAWKGLAAEAGSLVAFLADRDPGVYRRYGHWWAKNLPAAETRLLPGGGQAPL